jgi:uncharacterized protein (DUF1697 family)
MQTYISILRGINVSGHKMIKMESLRKIYEDLKFKNVKTYIQSGNVIFQDKPAKPELLKEKIAKQILKETGFEVPVMVKDINEISSVLKSNPFLKRKEDPAKLHVTFLSAEPGKEALNKIAEGKYGKDEFILSGRTVFLFCPDGYGNTKLSNNFFENKLKLIATTRNWKTINELHRMALELSQE